MAPNIRSSLQFVNSWTRDRVKVVLSNLKVALLWLTDLAGECAASLRKLVKVEGLQTSRDLKARAGTLSIRYLDRFDGTLGPEFLGWHDLLGEDNVDYCRLTVFKNLKIDIAILEGVTDLYEKLENVHF